jgi:hypothetical protein
MPNRYTSLVPEGGDRAPDRLFEAWAGADHDAPAVVIRQIDPALTQQFRE